VAPVTAAGAVAGLPRLVDVVLAEEEALRFPGMVRPLLLAAVGAVVLWLLALAGVLVATRARASWRDRRPWSWARSHRRWSIC
jgi:hypothetical protein